MDGVTSLRFVWAGLPQGALALLCMALAVAVLGGVFLLYRGERADRRRWVACGLRMVVLAGVALILLRPSVARDVERTLPGRVVVLADRSASMTVQDAADGRTRHEALVDMLSGEAGILSRLAEVNRVEMSVFAEQVRRLLEADRGAGQPSLPEWEPTGQTTDLAGAVAAGLEPSERLAAVVVLSDGRQTAEGSPAEAARRAQRAGVALYTIGLGTEAAPRNVAVDQIVSNDYAFRDQPLRMTALVRAQGYAGRPVEVVLTARGPAEEPGREVLRRELTLADRGFQQVDLTHAPQRAGPVDYVASIEPMDGERTAEDNAASRRVMVKDEPLRVLLLAGGPSREYRFIAPLLERSREFAVDAMPAGPAPSAQELAGYAVVVLCDVGPAVLTRDWTRALARLVDEEGVGLVFGAGPTHTPEQMLDPQMDALRELLPVVPDTAAVRAMVGGGGPYAVPRPVEPVPDAAHPVLQAAAGEQDVVAFWSSVPPLYWVLPASRPKAGAAPLLRCTGPDGEAILLAAQPYGLGRVLYCGSPGTWRWRRVGIEPYERFWLSAVRYCARGALGARAGRAALILERSEYEPGQPVTIRARLRDEDLSPLEAETVQVTVEHGGRAVGRVALRPADAPGTYQGVFYPRGFGQFVAIYEAPDGLRVAEPFQVRRPEAEFADVRMDRGALERMARLSGGQYLEPQQADRLAELIPDRSQTVVERGPLRPAWARPWILALLVGLLAGEWVLRKLMGLL